MAKKSRSRSNDLESFNRDKYKALEMLKYNRQISNDEYEILISLLTDIGSDALIEKLYTLNKLTEFCALYTYKIYCFRQLEILKFDGKLSNDEYEILISILINKGENALTNKLHKLKLTEFCFFTMQPYKFTCCTVLQKLKSNKQISYSQFEILFSILRDTGTDALIKTLNKLNKLTEFCTLYVICKDRIRSKTSKKHSRKTI